MSAILEGVNTYAGRAVAESQSKQSHDLKPLM